MKNVLHWCKINRYVTAFFVMLNYSIILFSISSVKKKKNVRTVPDFFPRHFNAVQHCTFKKKRYPSAAYWRLFCKICHNINFVLLIRMSAISHCAKHPWFFFFLLYINSIDWNSSLSKVSINLKTGERSKGSLRMYLRLAFIDPRAHVSSVLADL